MAEEQERKKRVVVELLGWLTESSIMPKKQRSIERVGRSSILELKSQLYKSQEESRKSKELNSPDVEFHRAKKKITLRDSFSSKNSGVEARALKGQASPLVFRKVRPPTRKLKTTYKATRPNLFL